MKRDKFYTKGYEIINEVFSKEEIQKILDYLRDQNIEEKFGVREFLKTNPELYNLVINHKLKQILNSLGNNFNIVKSIYFDKPPSSNWIVNWHQDLTINVNGKISKEGYRNWRTKKERIVVQPPIEILKNITTIRIHLDDCNKENGALRVIEDSHKNGVIEVKNGLENYKNQEKICEIKRGGILLMKPLILHASRRTKNDKRRRVIHIEFSNMELPLGIDWNEKYEIKNKACV